MEAEKASFKIARMARLLGVSTSGFYVWRQRRRAGLSGRAAAARDLDVQVRRVHADSDGVYGAPRVTAQLEREGVHVNVKTVAASMRRQGVEGMIPCRFTPVTTIAGVATYHIPDLVKRCWDQGAVNLVWIDPFAPARCPHRLHNGRRRRIASGALSRRVPGARFRRAGWDVRVGLRQQSWRSPTLS